MSEYVQTSVEEINLIAAQLRYKIESTLQLWSQQRQHAQSAKDERLSEIALGENFPDCRLSSSDTSSAGALENDFLHREVLDLKQVIDKFASQMRTKDSSLKTCKDELKQEKLNREVDCREQKKINADSKSNERYMKCLQIEYELLRNMTAKSQEAYLLIGAESMKQTSELDKTSKMVRKQMKEILEINEENKSLMEEVKKLNIVITKLRAAAGVNFSILKQSQLGMEKTDEKKNRLLSRQVSLTDRLDKERHLNKMLQQKVEETELKATTAFEGITLASQQQATLVKRLNDFSSEIVYLKDVLNEQRSEISTLQKKVVSGNQATNGSATADNCFAPPTNENSGIAGSNRKSEAAAAYDRPSHSVAERRKTSESLLSRDDDQEDLKGQDFGGRIEMQEESAGMAAKSLTQGEGLAALEEQVHESVKKRRTEQSDEVNSILSNSMAIKQGEYQYWGADEDVLETPKSIPKSLAKSVNSKISAVAQQRSPPIEALEMDIDDDRCPVCLDSPFGLMVLCSGCRYALHSACAKKSGGGATGKDFKCPKCSQAGRLNR